MVISEEDIRCFIPIGLTWTYTDFDTTYAEDV